jgi:hypothetical protein
MNHLLKSYSTLFLLALLTLIGCKEKNDITSATTLDSTHKRTTIKDEKASKLVSAMWTAMGGEEQWDNLQYVSWTFFGARHLVWDKIGGRVRIDSPRDTSIYLLNLNSLEGKVIKGGEEVTDPEELKKLLNRAEGIWINDAYWLFMPFKLQDPGVTVNYMREDTMLGGQPASVLALTFEEVGNTPENKYEVYIDKADNLIKQWAYFKEADQETPPKIWPWDNYQSYNGLMLSSDRSDKSGPSNVRIYDTLEDKVFNSFDVFDYF